MPSERRLNLHYYLMQAGYWTIYAAVCGYHASLLLERGFTDGEVGIVLAIRCFAGVVIQPILGAFSDKHPNLPLKKIIVACLAASLVAQVIYIGFNFGMLGTILVYIVIGGLELSAYPFLDSMAVQYINSGVNIQYSLGRGIGSFFYAVTCVLMGFQVTVWGAQSTMVTHAVLIAAEMLIVMTFPTFQGEIVPAERKKSPHTTLEMLRANPKFTVTLLAVFFGITAGLPAVMFMIQIITSIGGNDGTMGIALFVMGAAELPAALLFTKLNKKISSHKLLVASIFFLTVKVTLFALAPNVPLFIVAQLIQLVSYGLFTPSSVFFVNETVPEEDRVKGQTLMMAFGNGMGGAVGGLLGGWLLDLGGVPLMMAVLIGLGVVGTVLGLISLRMK